MMSSSALAVSGLIKSVINTPNVRPNAALKFMPCLNIEAPFIINISTISLAVGELMIAHSFTQGVQ
jgi:hypothetical protein